MPLALGKHQAPDLSQAPTPINQRIKCSGGPAAALVAASGRGQFPLGKANVALSGGTDEHLQSVEWCVCENDQTNANLPSSARELQCTSSRSFANGG